MKTLFPLLLLFAWQSVQAEPSDGCGASQLLASDEYQLQVDGIPRRFLLDLPDTDIQVPPPLVLALHGYTGSPEIIGSPMTQEVVDTVTQMGWVLVRPASTIFETRLNPATAKALGVITSESEWHQIPEHQRIATVSSWNDLAASQSQGPAGPLCLSEAETYPCPPECGECGPCVWGSCHDDVGFLKALIDELDRTVCFDRTQRYVLGHSNGGMMAHAVTCQLPELFAGGASIKGQPELGFACDSPRAPSFIQIAGAQDQTVPADGSTSSDGYFYESSMNSAAKRAQSLQCQRGPSTGDAEPLSRVTCNLWDACNEGKRVADCLDPVGGHEWPGDQDDGQWGLELILGFWDGVDVFRQADES